MHTINPQRVVMFATIAAIAIGTAIFWQAQPAASAQSKAPVLVNLTSSLDDMHSLSMGLGLVHSALEKGHAVTVFINVHAPVIAAADLSEDVQYADFPPLKTMLAEAIEKGADVYVCNHCASVCGVDVDALAEGVTISDHGQLLDALDSGMVGFSY